MGQTSILRGRHVPAHLRIGVFIAGACVAACALAPQAASAAYWTGGEKGIPGYSSAFYALGARQTIETQQPIYWDIYSGANLQWVAEAAYPMTNANIAQLGYGVVQTIYTQPTWFWEFDCDATSYHPGPQFFGSPPAIGSSYTYAMYRDTTLWHGTINGVEKVHTGVDNISWAPNSTQGFGETWVSSDHFAGTTDNHVSFSGQSWWDGSAWHGGVLYQYHLTSYGQNDITSPSGQGAWTQWDSRD